MKRTKILLIIITLILTITSATSIVLADYYYSGSLQTNYSRTDIWVTGDTLNEDDPNSVTLKLSGHPSQNFSTTEIWSAITTNGPYNSDTATQYYTTGSILNYVIANTGLPTLNIPEPILDLTTDTWTIDRKTAGASSVLIYAGIRSLQSDGTYGGNTLSWGSHYAYDRLIDYSAWVDSKPTASTENLTQTTTPTNNISWGSSTYSLAIYDRYYHLAVRTISGRTNTLTVKIPATPYYAVYYNLNGAEGTAPTAKAQWTHKALSVTSDIPTRAGYTFLGWNTQADGKGTSYPSSGLIDARTTDLTLYAQWQADNVTATYIDVIGSTTGQELGRQTKSVTLNSTVRGSDLGSSTAENAYYNGYKYVSDTSTTASGNVTVYRIFEQILTSKTITKIWNDENNKYLTRPTELGITLYQNQVKYRDLKINGQNNTNQWTLIINDLPKYDSNGNLYVYTVLEDTENLQIKYFYKTPEYNQNTLTITNTASFIPLNITELAEYRITISKVFLRNNQPINLTVFNNLGISESDIFNFPIVLKELNRTVTNTGTALVESYSGYTGKEIHGILKNDEDLVVHLGQNGAGKYEISEQSVTYFDFIDIEKLNTALSSSGANFSKENGKYYITISGITGQYEQINIQVINDLENFRGYQGKQEHNSLFN